jgi:hypothetical protein
VATNEMDHKTLVMVEVEGKPMMDIMTGMVISIILVISIMLMEIGNIITNMKITDITKVITTEI